MDRIYLTKGQCWKVKVGKKKTIQKMKSLEMDSSGKEKSEKGQFYIGKNKKGQL